MTISRTNRLQKRLEEEGLRTTDPNSIAGLAPKEKLGTEIKVEDVLLEYRFRSADRTFCYVCGLSKHYNGFVMLLTNNAKILVGNCCAKRIADQDLLNAATNRFEAKKSAVNFDEAAKAKIEILPMLLEEIDLLKHYCDQLDEISKNLDDLLSDNRREILYNARENNNRLVINRSIESSAKEASKNKFDDSDKDATSIEAIFDQPVFGISFLRKSKRIELTRHKISIYLESLRERANYKTKKKEIGNAEFLKTFNAQIRDAYEEMLQHFEDANRFLADQNLSTIDRFIRYQNLPTSAILHRNTVKNGEFFTKAHKLKKGLSVRPRLKIFDDHVSSRRSTRR